MNVNQQRGRIRAAVALGVVALAAAVMLAPAVRGKLAPERVPMRGEPGAANTTAPPASAPGTLVNPGDRHPGRFASSADSVVVYAVHRFDHYGPTNSYSDYDDTFSPDSIAGWRYVIEVVNVGCTHAWIGVAGQEVIGSNDLSSRVLRAVDVYPTPGQTNDIWITVQATSGSNKYVSVRIVRVKDPTFRQMRDTTHVGPSPGGGYVDTFTQIAGDSMATIRVVNGDASGFNRVTGATLKLNGVQVLGPSDFNTGYAIIERQAALRKPMGRDTLVLTGQPSGKQLSIRVLTRDITPPVINLNYPMAADTFVTDSSSLTISGTVVDEVPGLARVNSGSDKAVPGSFSGTVALPTDGTYEEPITTINSATLSTTRHPYVVRDTQAPLLNVTWPSSQVICDSSTITVQGTWHDLSRTVVVTDGDTVGVDTSGSFNRPVALDLGSTTILIRARDKLGRTTEVRRTVFRTTTGEAGARDSNSVVADALSQTSLTPFASGVQFIYAGGSPVQLGVVTDSLDQSRLGVIRGRVVARDWGGLGNDTVSVLGHPEFGYTLTRNDGRFDLVVNGGGVVTLRFSKPGYLETQRQVEVPSLDYVTLADVAVIGKSAKRSVVSTSTTQVTRGRFASDANGDRDIRVVFPQNVAARIVKAPGDTTTVTQMRVRATEFTVGDDGPETMPAMLPPSSAYTYCVDLRLDEADSIASIAGALPPNTQFTQPIPCYVRNFLHVPPGTAIPAGCYDQQGGQWIAAHDGIALKIVGSSGGLAQVDANNDGQADSDVQRDSLGITTAELSSLLSQFSVGDTVCRIAVSHFSPWDFNYNLGDLLAQITNAAGKAIRQPALIARTCLFPGSIIECDNRVLGQSLPIVGTPFTLNYRSYRASGDSVMRTVRVPIASGGVPAGVQKIIVRLDVAGQRITQEFPPSVPQDAIASITWNGRDAYGRTVQGAVNAKLSIGYQYEVIYSAGSGSSQGSLGDPVNKGPSLGSASGSRAVGRISWSRQTVSLGAPSTGSDGLGGWTISPHHFLDLTGSGVVYGGDGSILGDQTRPTISTYAGAGSCNPFISTNCLLNETDIDPVAIAIAPDRSLYLADNKHGAIFSVTPSGALRLLAGMSSPGAYAYGVGVVGDAHATHLRDLTALAVAADGSVYFTSNHAFGADFMVGRVTVDGKIVKLVGGNDDYPWMYYSGGDGGLAGNGWIVSPYSIAVGPDGSVFIGEHDDYKVRRIAPNGIISTYAGTGSDQPGTSDSTGRGTAIRLGGVDFLSCDGDGNLYICDAIHDKIRRVAPDGIISTWASSTGLQPSSIALAPDGSYYITSNHGPYVSALNQVWRRDIDGTLAVVAGGGSLSADGSPAQSAALGTPVGIACAQDGSYFVTNGGAVIRISQSLWTRSGNEAIVPSEDGRERYYFDLSTGRHVRTSDTFTGAIRYRFNYDDSGRLRSIYDLMGDSTLVQRDSNGDPIGIVGPFGHRTRLTVSGQQGFLASMADTLSLANPMAFDATPDGLLRSFRDVAQNLHQFTYASDGRLQLDQQPTSAGGSQTLGVTYSGNSRTVTRTSAEGRTASYSTVDLADGTRQRRVTDERNLLTYASDTLAGQSLVWNPDRSSSQASLAPDPRSGFGMASPFVSKMTDSLPSGQVRRVSVTRSVPAGFAPPAVGGTWQEDVAVNQDAAFHTEFNGDSIVLRTASPEHRLTKIALNVSGRPRTVWATAIDTVQYGYDAHGRLTHVAQGGRAWRYAYDTKGRLNTVTDTLNHQTQFGYDDIDRLKTETLPDNQVVNFDYDANGNLKTVTPPGQPAHTFDFTAINLPQHYIPPAANGTGDNTNYTTTYSYNLDGQLKTILRPDGATVTLNYESGTGRLQSVDIPPRGTVTYKYKTLGQLDSLISPDNLHTGYTYDGPLPLSESWRGPTAGRVDVSYDAQFRPITQMVDSSSSAAFTYDADGFLTGAGLIGIHRLASNGLIDSTWLSVGTASSSQDYNSAGELRDLHYSWSGGAYSQSFQRDSVGRILTLNDVAPSGTNLYAYQYTSTGRLSQVTQNSVLYQSYGYDGNGNRISVTTATTVDSLTYDAQDRLLSYGHLAHGYTRYAYTTSGELTQKVSSSGTSTYSYDELGNLIAAHPAGGPSIVYLIDGANRRVGKVVNGTYSKGWLYQNGLNFVAEVNAASQVVSRFVYGSRTNVPDYMVQGSTTYRMISDQLGSVRLVVNATTGAIAQRLEYDAWGNVLTDTSPGFQPFGFAGGLYDPDTKLVRFGARDYDASVGRWTCKDPAGLALAGPNLFEYVDSSPISATDPSGLWQYYKNWGGPGWTNGTTRWRETDHFPHLPGQPGYVPPANARDELYREHDVDLSHCARIQNDRLRRECRREADIDLASKIWRFAEDHPTDPCKELWFNRRAEEIFFAIPDNPLAPGFKPGPYVK